MPKFIGRKLSVGIGLESIRGTGVAPTYWLNATAFSHKDVVVKANSEATTGGIWGGDQSLVARKMAEGDIEVEMDDNSFGLILLATLGDVSSAVFGGANKHTYTLQNDAQHPSLSISTDDPINEQIFEFGMIDSLSMEFLPEEIVKYTVAFKSKNAADSSVTPAFAAANKFLGRQLEIKVASLASGLTAASKVQVSRAAITFEKNTDFYNVVGSVQPEDIYNKRFNVTGELELSYEDDTFRDFMNDGSYQALRFDLVNSDVTIGTTNPSFRIDLSRVEFEGWEPAYPLDDLVTQTITFSALYDYTNGDLINDLYLINKVTSY